MEDINESFYRGITLEILVIYIGKAGKGLMKVCLKRFKVKLLAVSAAVVLPPAVKHNRYKDACHHYKQLSKKIPVVHGFNYCGKFFHSIINIITNGFCSKCPLKIVIGEEGEKVSGEGG